MPEPGSEQPQRVSPAPEDPNALPTRRTIVVGPPRDDDEAMPLVSSRDLGSASRSCLAIIVVLLFIALIICVFLAIQPFR
ncbi:MAG: hypothetical protein WBA46_16690 [Thermomicrobiales bacterium]